MFYRFPFSPLLCQLCPDSGLKTQIHDMPNGKCELDKFADPLFSQQKQIGFPVLLNC